MTEIAATKERRPGAVYRVGEYPIPAARISAFLALLTVIAAFCMPLVVAYDDARALQKWEEEKAASEPVKILGFELSFGEDDEFVPPSEKGRMGECVMLFMVLIFLAGLAAAVLGGVAAIAGPERSLGASGAIAGVSGVVLAAYLSPMGLIVLAIIAAALLFAAIFGGIASAFSAGAGC